MARPRPASNDWPWRSIRLHTREKREKLPAISVSCSSVGTCPGQPKVLQGRESQSSRR
jgi:hypothetical protein